MARGDIQKGTTVNFIGVLRDDDNNIIDISGASLQEITFQRPSGEDDVETATNVTDGINGEQQFNKLLDEAGRWGWQHHVVISGIPSFFDIHYFNVKENL